MKKVNLFSTDDENDTENISKIVINRDFAKRFEYNKKREDLQRLEELKKQGRVSDSNSDSESDSSDDEDVDLDDINTLEFWNALLLARNKDPILKQKDVNLFASSESSEEEEGEEKGQGQKNIVIGKGKGKKLKPKYLKDVNAEHLIEMGPEFGDREEEEEEEGNAKKKKKVKSYSEEQGEMRKEILDDLENADIEAGGEGDFFKEKGGEKEDIEQLDQEVENKLAEYFEEDAKLDEGWKFLMDYFKNKMWVDKEGKSSFDDDVRWFSEEEEEIERQERHEKERNFRFEEGTEDRVETHSRVIADSVRKKDNARKEQRKRKKERLEQAEIERQEEVKRLKNLKKREIMDKIYKIREVSGLGEEAIPLTEAYLEEEFDPEEYDKKMNAAFGEEYYDADDVDPEFGSGGSDLEKPDFEKEDKLLGLTGSWDVYDKPGGVFLNEWEKYKKDSESKMDAVNDEQDQRQGGGEGEEDLRHSKRKRKRKMSLKEKLAIDKDLEELYKLDYEDTIGDLKTRFKYKQVNPERYGLHTEDILSIDDKELNQYVSIKKLAPYREKEWNVPLNKKNEFKKKNKLAPHRENERKDQHKNNKVGDDARSNTDATQAQEDNHVQVEQKTKSRKAKRRERNKYEISDTRKMAYGKVISKSKGKPKQ